MKPFQIVRMWLAAIAHRMAGAREADVPIPADIPSPSAMIALVETAEHHEREFQRLSPVFITLGQRIGKPGFQSRVKALLREWQSVHGQIAETFQKQTEATKNAAVVFKRMYDDYVRVGDQNEQIQREYADLYANFSQRLERVAIGPAYEDMRQAWMAVQVLLAQKEGMEARIKSLEAGKVPETEKHVSALTEALNAEVSAKRRLFWYMSGMIAGPALVVFVFWLSRV